MSTATIVTPWKGSGTYIDPYRPALPSDHPVSSWADLAAANPALNQSYTIGVICDAATLTAIQNDLKYQITSTGTTHGS